MPDIKANSCFACSSSKWHSHQRATYRYAPHGAFPCLSCYGALTSLYSLSVCCCSLYIIFFIHMFYWANKRMNGWINNSWRRWVLTVAAYRRIHSLYSVGLVGLIRVNSCEVAMALPLWQHYTGVIIIIICLWRRVQRRRQYTRGK